MKKKVLCGVMILLMTLALCACGKGNNEPANAGEDNEQVTNQDAGSTEGDDVQAEGSTEVNTSDYVIIGDSYVVFLKKNDATIKIFDAYEDVVGDDSVPYVSTSEIIGDYVYLTTISYSDDSHMFVYDFDGNRVDDIPILKEMSGVGVDEYQDKVYLYYSEYTKEIVGGEEKYLTKYTCLEYDPRSKATVKNIELGDKMTAVENSGLSLIGSKGYFSMLKEFGCIYGFDYNTREIVKLDESGNNLARYMLNGDKAYVLSAFSHYGLTYESHDGPADRSDVIQTLYDFNTQKTVEVYNGDSVGSWNFLDGNDEYMYYYYCDSTGYNYNIANYYVKRYNIATGESEDLYECEGLPGRESYYMTPGVSGFKLVDSKAYYAYYSGADAKVFECSIDDKSTKETDAVLHHYDVFDYADVEYVEENTDYPGHEGVTCYYFYDEKVKIKSSVKNADKINAALEKNDNSLAESAQASKEDMLQEEYYDDWHYYSALERRIEGIKQIGSRYLLVNFDNYWYAGGAHGMNDKECSLFDLETGDKVTAKDLSSLTEDEFKKAVAEATIEDWKNDDSYKYFNSYCDNPGSEADFYQELYNNASFDMLMTWNDKGIIIMYPPYQYGSYATGYICISIPYEKVGITIE